MKAIELLKGCNIECLFDLDITGLALDSRLVQPDDAFIALHGANYHGISFVDAAIVNGAKLVIYDPEGTDDLDLDFHSLNVANIAVPELHKQLGNLAASFYGNPSKQLTVIGVTGTNGKTTCSQLIAQTLPNCGVIGTLGWGEPQCLLPTLNTTPDALSIHSMLKHFADTDKRYVAMEVSSHGLQQGRVNAVDFTGAVFTNLSRDHLDYHTNMADYLNAKLILFTNPALKFAIINLDDQSSAAVLQNLADNVRIWTFSTQGLTVADAESIVAKNIHHLDTGIEFEIVWGNQTRTAFTPLVGSFNLENVLAVLGVMLAINIPLSDAIDHLAKLNPIVGRMEKFGGNLLPTVFVDYAHSPDALQKVLTAAKGKGRLLLVFGCGGNRDKGKRAEMGKIAETFADKVFITDDNPRNEKSEEIIKDILLGCQSQNITVISDRKQAIIAAINQAEPTDRVMIVGKGHESYQEINDSKIPFSDQEVVKLSLVKWSHKR